MEFFTSVPTTRAGAAARRWTGFRPSVFSSSLGGIEPAFILREGLPQEFERPPFIDTGLLNGQDGPLYRPFDANRLPYTQQWNLTVERQFTNNFHVSAAYVGNKGTRLLSQKVPFNVLNPSLLSRGQALFDEFEEGQSQLNGVPNPYPGWESQLEACAPSVAQALAPYPQYCGSLLGLNENAGNSTYHSLQIKAEHRFSRGFWFLLAYTASKTLTDSDIIQSISTYGKCQRCHIAIRNGPEQSAGRRGRSSNALDGIRLRSAVWQGKTLSLRRRFLGQGFRRLGAQQHHPRPVGYAVVLPLECVQRAGQFQAACIPAVLEGANPFEQTKSDFDPRMARC